MQVASYPPLRPLVLVLKTFMKSQGLAEVATGGLSSYGLTYMVLAHLMVRGVAHRVPTFAPMPQRRCTSSHAAT